MLKKSFNRKDLSYKIYKILGFPKNLSLKIVDDFFEVIVSQLVESKMIKISSFGTFEVIKKKERVGRNPKTRKIAKISARKVVKFKPSLDFKKKINSYEHKS